MVHTWIYIINHGDCMHGIHVILITDWWDLEYEQESEILGLMAGEGIWMWTSPSTSEFVLLKVGFDHEQWLVKIRLSICRSKAWNTHNVDYKEETAFQQGWAKCWITLTFEQLKCNVWHSMQSLIMIYAHRIYTWLASMGIKSGQWCRLFLKISIRIRQYSTVDISQGHTHEGQSLD